MSLIIGILTMALLAILQSAVLSRVLLIQGKADLVLTTSVAWALFAPSSSAWQWTIWGGILIGLISELPLWVPLSSYALGTVLALILRKRVWQLPLLVMLVVTFVSTLTLHGLSIIALRLNGVTLPLGFSITNITIPSLLLNLLFALPIYGLIGDLAGWLYPREIEV
ncbi:MAG: hypothetical protein AB1345_07900 [Chloroflexota bacterium]